MRFYVIMTVATVLGGIVAAGVLFLAGHLIIAVLPHAGAVAVDLFRRARAHGSAALVGYWLAWVLLLPVMLLICLVGGIRRLWREGRRPKQPYAHLTGSSARSDPEDEAD